MLCFEIIRYMFKLLMNYFWMTVINIGFSRPEFSFKARIQGYVGLVITFDTVICFLKAFVSHQQ